MYLSRGLTFYGDEWAIIARGGDWSIADLMRPHNEHWMLGFKLVYKALMAVFGLGTYMPYMAVTLALHVAAAAALYVYARRQTVPVIAYAIGLVFLLLGTAGEDLFMAMQINFNGSTAAGAWALVILMREPTPRHGLIAAVLLLVSVSFSGIGLFFLAAAGAIIIVAPSLRRWWWTLAPAVLAYGAWYLAYGRGAQGPISRLPELIEFTRVGIANAVGQLSGLRTEMSVSSSRSSSAWRRSPNWPASAPMPRRAQGPASGAGDRPTHAPGAHRGVRRAAGTVRGDRPGAG